MQQELYELIIIGSGPAGLTAGIYASRANLYPLIFEGATPGGQLMSTSYIENWPGSKSILGPQLMMEMRAHAQHFGSTLIAETVISVDFQQRPFSITTNKNRVYTAKSIIVTTGATPKRLGCRGEDEYWGKGVTTCAVCDGAFYQNQEVIVVGGGDTAMEDASFLTKFTNKITIVHILDKLTASAAMQERVLSNPNIKIIYNSTVQEFQGDGKRVQKAIIKNINTGQTHTISATGIFVAVGLNPNTSLFKDQLELDKFGYIAVTDHTKTSIDGIFVAGDVADYRYRQAITSAGAGCMAALDVEHYLHSYQ